MTTPTLADLRRDYYGGGSDAEYAALQAAKAAGVTAVSALTASQKQGFEKIAEQELLAPATTIDMIGIPQGYKTLKIYASLRGDSAAAFVETAVNINNDVTDANYFQERFQGSAAAVSAVENLGAASSRRCGLMPAGTAPANLFGQMELTVVDYARADKIKAIEVKTSSCWALGAGGMLVRVVSLFRNNIAAIDRIALQATAGNLVAGSVMSVYGAKSAFG